MSTKQDMSTDAEAAFRELEGRQAGARVQRAVDHTTQSFRDCVRRLANPNRPWEDSYGYDVTCLTRTTPDTQKPYQDNFAAWKRHDGQDGYTKLDSAMMTNLAWGGNDDTTFPNELAQTLRTSHITDIDLSKNIGSNLTVRTLTDAQMDNIIRNLPATVKNINITGDFSEQNLKTLLNWTRTHKGVNIRINTEHLKGNDGGRISDTTFKALCSACKNGQISTLTTAPRYRHSGNEDIIVNDPLLCSPSSPELSGESEYTAASLQDLNAIISGRLTDMDMGLRMRQLKNSAGDMIISASGDVIFMSREARRQLGREGGARPVTNQGR